MVEISVFDRDFYKGIGGNSMKSIVIWGTGGGMRKAFCELEIINRLNSIQYKVLALADNDESKWGLVYNRTIPVVSHDEWKRMNYDYVVIASTAQQAIKSQLVDVGVPKDKVYDWDSFHEIIFSRCWREVLQRSECLESETMDRRNY